jgi:hypothetical protein
MGFQYKGMRWLILLALMVSVVTTSAADNLEVLSATYGAEDVHKDVTSIVASKIVDGRLEFSASSGELGGDPIFGKVKELRLKVLVNGQEQEITYREGERVELTSVTSPISSTVGQSSQIEHSQRAGDEAVSLAAAQPHASNSTARDANSANKNAAHQPAEDLSPEVLDAMVIIKGREGSGSGFICSLNGKTYIVTNQHVISGLTNARFQTRGGVNLQPVNWQIATDVDLVIMEVQGLPEGVKPLELLNDLSKRVAQADKVTIPGNSEGHGVVTQTHGQLLAIGGQRIETDAPVYPGNSGSPIIHRKTGKVIGVLTEAERLIFNEFTKHSFRDKNSAIKSEVRYFGYRLDTVASWRPITASAMNAERSLLDASRQELNWIADLFTGASDAYKEYKELHLARNEAFEAFNRRDLAFSEKERAQKRFLWRLSGMIKRAADRVPKRPLVFVHQDKAESVKALAANLATGVGIVERDDALTVELIKRGF